MLTYSASLGDVKPFLEDIDEKKIFEFKLTLLGIEPPIWRRIAVPGGSTFWNLHSAIQDAMQWNGLFMFRFLLPQPESNVMEWVGYVDEYSTEDDRFYICPAWEMRITEYFTTPGQKCTYAYTPIGTWEFSLVLEAIRPRPAKGAYPHCLDGARACPIENSTHEDYENMLEVLRDPNHPKHETVRKELGSAYNPELFHAKDVRFKDPQARLGIMRKLRDIAVNTYEDEDWDESDMEEGLLYEPDTRLEE